MTARTSYQSDAFNTEPSLARSPARLVKAPTRPSAAPSSMPSAELTRPGMAGEKAMLTVLPAALPAITVTVGQVETPWGVFGAALSATGLGRLTLPDEPYTSCETWASRWYPGAQRAGTAPGLATLAEELKAYLAGKLRAFSVPVDLQGTPFQVRVWRALTAIRYGQVCSYADLAASIGQPKAVRAVGLANGANPVPIIVPCHRVIGSNGSLTGYGGGLHLKERLLLLERPAAVQPKLL